MTKKKTHARGSTSDMDALHGALTDTYADALRKYREAGEIPPPQFLSALQRFLAENGIDTPAFDRKFDRLKGELPDMDELARTGNVVPLKKA